jgi:hypothetical protein
LLMALTSTALISTSAWSADLRLPTRTGPVWQREAPSDWRQRLFEEFQRYLLGKVAKDSSNECCMSWRPSSAVSARRAG